LSRKLLNSEIMDKPPLFFKLWGWMLLQARFKADDKLECGQFVTSISSMREAMAYYSGYRKETPTVKQIRGIYGSLAERSMIGTMKVTGGLLITILNYEEYQNPKNYEGHNGRVHGGNLKGTPYKKKNGKKGITKRIADSTESAKPKNENYYLTKSGKKLTGKRLETFDVFWELFNFKQGKAAAADSWLKIPTLTNEIIEQINHAASIEAKRRPELEVKGASPKWPQGWLSERRWEDESYTSVNGANLTEAQVREKYDLC